MTKYPLKKISVIIPSYNSGKFLNGAIESVVKQTYKNLEIIINDGSTDNTEEVLKGFNNKRIKYIRLKENSGGSAVPRNAGLKATKGKYIAFLDSDDEWLPEKLEKQLDLFKKSVFGKQLGFVACHAIIIKDDKRFIHKIPNYRGNIIEEILSSCFVFSASSVLLKREVIISERFDKNFKFAPDWDTWIRIAREYDFDFVSEPLFKYYIHKNNFMRSLKGLSKVRGLKYILEKYQEVYKKHPRVHSVRLRDLGTAYLLNGDLKTARKSFIRAITTPLYLRSCINFIVSLFGYSLYKKILNQKRKMTKSPFLDYK
ncbi:MAG: glycosyltransferase family 2 protein [Candidatus Nealsonbacteria bacterium]